MTATSKPNFVDMPMMPTYCPNCHKSFFGAGMAVKTCHCEKGRKLIKEWMDHQKAATEHMTDPSEALIDIPEETNDADA